MGVYFSKDVVIAAFNELAHLTEYPDKQGQTTKVSALKYAAALSRFDKEQRRDFNTRDLEDKRIFESYVGDVVAFCDGWATINFFEKFTNAPDYKVGSNLYSSTLVSDSLKEPNEEFPFPRKKYKPLFYLKGGKLLSSSICSDVFGYYLNTKSLRVAFIVWLSRNLELPGSASEFTILDQIKNEFIGRYNDAFIEGVWGGEPLSIKDLNHYHKELFACEPSSISKKDFVGCAHPSVLGQPHNYIFFGAPGTGKSYQLNKLARESFPEGNMRRVTFYPDYTYSQFVGGFKPYSEVVLPEGRPASEMASRIEYRFVPGPFLETYMDACRKPEENFLLIIEEINRANPAAVFGDIFQLLDRKADGESEYSVATPFEMRNYLEVFLPAGISQQIDIKTKESPYDRLKRESARLSLPPNMYIWATMNSADQGVFPMDTAFKRRWDFRYMDIDGGADVIADKVVSVAGSSIVWDKLRRAINNLMTDSKINEDKLLGPFFVSPAALNDERFIDVFKDKVLLYLYEDAGKMKRKMLFADEKATYSKLCNQFKDKGVGVFKGIELADVVADVAEDADAEQAQLFEEPEE